MGLIELEPHLTRVYKTILERKNQSPQDPNSTTVRLLQTGWMSSNYQTINPNVKPEIVHSKGNLVKLGGIGDKLLEEASEIARSETEGRDNIIDESSQVLYYLMVGCVVMKITPAVLFQAIDEVYEEQINAIVPPNKLAETASAAVGRIALAGVKGNPELVLRRSAEAIVSLNRFWEAHGVSAIKVGEKI